GLGGLRKGGAMIDLFDIIAFVLFGVLLTVIVQVAVTLGSLPGQVGQKRGHPQAAAISIASWGGIAALGLGAVWTGPDARTLSTIGLLWPLALVWAFLKPNAAGPPLAERQPDGHQRPGGEGVAS